MPETQRTCLRFKLICTAPSPVLNRILQDTPPAAWPSRLRGRWHDVENAETNPRVLAASRIASVACLIFPVRRGCWDPGSFNGKAGKSS
eukprot:768463-Hanusia_phi.AAC.6